MLEHNIRIMGPKGALLRELWWEKMVPWWVVYGAIR